MPSHPTCPFPGQTAVSGVCGQPGTCSGFCKCHLLGALVDRQAVTSPVGEGFAVCGDAARSTAALVVWTWPFIAQMVDNLHPPLVSSPTSMF